MPIVDLVNDDVFGSVSMLEYPNRDLIMVTIKARDTPNVPLPITIKSLDERINEIMTANAIIKSMILGNPVAVTTPCQTQLTPAGSHPINFYISAEASWERDQ